METLRHKMTMTWFAIACVAWFPASALSLLSLAGCGNEVDRMQTVTDPFAGLSGKADGQSFTDVTWTVVFETDAQRLTVRGDGREAVYEDVEVRDHPGAERRFRLARGDRFAGMRSLLVVDGSVPALSAQHHLAAAVGFATPRAAVVRFVEDDSEPRQLALVEHVGDRFLRSAFDSEGILLRYDSEIAVNLIQMDPEELTSLRTLTEFFDVETLGMALALTQVDDSFRVSFASLFASQRTAVLHEIGAVVTGRDLQPALRHPGVRASYERALQRARAYQVEQGQSVAALDEHLSWLGSGNVAVGSAQYRRQRWVGPLIEVRFRHLRVDAVATGVQMGLNGVVEVAEFDADANLWIARFEPPFEPSTVILDVTYSRADSDRFEQVVSPRLDELVALRVMSIDVNEPSGLAWRNGELLVIGDEGNKVFGLDPRTGERLWRVNVGVRGMEGVAVDLWRNELLVADEDRGDIIRLDFDGEEQERHHFGWADDRDGGIEGLTSDPVTGHLFFAKETSPARIAELSPDGELLDRRRVRFASDLSALCIDGSEGVLYALSDRDRRLYRLDADYDVERQWDLEIEKPEGLVVHEGRVYIVSDAQDELHVFELVR